MARTILVLDLGTTYFKAALFDERGCMLALDRQEYPLLTPAPNIVELDPEIYWQALVSAVRRVLAQSRAAVQEVATLCISSQGETFIPVDDHGRPLARAIVWLDNRATREAEGLAVKFSSEGYRKTGIPEIIPTWTACKILWLRQNRPDLFARADKFLLVQDYLIHRLTGGYSTNSSAACTTLYFDIVQNGRWGAILDEIGIGAGNLPELIPPGETAGRISREASAQTSLPQTTKVVGGGMDQSVGAIGAGNIRPGVVSETTGAALTIQVTIPSPDVDRNGVIPVYSHSVPGSYLFVPVCPTWSVCGRQPALVATREHPTAAPSTTVWMSGATISMNITRRSRRVWPTSLRNTAEIWRRAEGPITRSSS